MEDVRALLADEQARVMARLAALRADHDSMVAASLDTNADDEHDPEGVTIAFERSQIEALVQQARVHLREIHDAVARLDAGTYGNCEVCGGAVPPERLAARPTARSCVGCASRR